MPYQKFPLPKRFWFYLACFIVLPFLLILDFFIVGEHIGDPERYEFTMQDWSWIIIGLLVGAVIAALIHFSLRQVKKFNAQQEEQIQTYLDQFKYAGISPDDYDFIWIHFDGLTRAVIQKSGDCYHLHLEEFNCKTELWEADHDVRVYPSISDLKRALFYDYDFYCEENTVFDRHGEEIFKDDPS